MRRISEEVDFFEGQVIACIADPFRHTERIKFCNSRKVTLLSMDMIPRRLSRAQSMDVNSSQDNLAGYKAVLLGASMVPKGIPMMTTSAGTVRPAKVVSWVRSRRTASNSNGKATWSSGIRL